jgi:hypothetical protein
MDKLREEIRDLLKANITFWHGIPTDIWIEEISQATNQILKLFKQEMLRLIGEDEPEHAEDMPDNVRGTLIDVCMAIGRNRLRAELRKKKTGGIYG